MATAKKSTSALNTTMKKAVAPARGSAKKSVTPAVGSAKKSTKPTSAATIRAAKAAPARTTAATPSGAKPASGNKLEIFFCEELKDIYWAEKHLLKVLPKMSKSATSPKLKQAFEDHRKVTEGHVTRLETIFELMDKKAQAKKCEAMAGITKEGDDIISETDKGSETRDVGLILAAQKVEHYEIATYGGLAELARTIGKPKVASILEQTLAEEKEADESLSSLAKKSINNEAGKETEKETHGFFDRVMEVFS
jgi:ferritin-like metal-binding protein YciE